MGYEGHGSQWESSHTYLYAVHEHLSALMYLRGLELHLYKYLYNILACKPVFFKSSV